MSASEEARTRGTKLWLHLKAQANLATAGAHREIRSLPSPKSIYTKVLFRAKPTLTRTP